jgi:phage-related protein
MRNVLKQGDFRKMEEKIEGAIENIDAFEFLQARMRVEDLFTKFLDASNFKVANADGHNFEGEGIARSSNVLHMLDEYILPYFSQ